MAGEERRPEGRNNNNTGGSRQQHLAIEALNISRDKLTRNSGELVSCMIGRIDRQSCGQAVATRRRHPRGRLAFGEKYRKMAA